MEDQTAFLAKAIEWLSKIQKSYKPARYFLGVTGAFIVIRLGILFGFDSRQSILGFVGVVLAVLALIAIESITQTRKGTLPIVRNAGVVLIWSIPALVFLLASCIFFDWPKPIRPLLDSLSEQEENYEFKNEVANNWKTLMTFQRLDSDDCTYPVMLPDTVLTGKIQSEDTIIYGAFVYDTLLFKSRAPMRIKQGWGFSMPFQIEGKTKEATITLTNRFRIKVNTQNKIPAYAHAESTCGGEGALYDAKETVVLHAKKGYYEKVISFPQVDYFTLKPNEIIGFEIDFVIKDAGKYSVTVDAPYVYKGKKGVATFKLPDLIAPLHFDKWEFTYEYPDTTKQTMGKISTNVWV